MDNARRARLRELFFRVSVSLKGLDALLEIVGGIALLAVSPRFILRTLAFLTQDELAEDPRDRIANLLLGAAQHLSVSTEHFAAFYLLTHGITKIFLVGALLNDKRWAYPLAIVVFAAFIVYQLYRFTLTRGVGLIMLSLFDLLVIWLVWLEYRAARRRAPTSSDAARPAASCQ